MEALELSGAVVSIQDGDVSTQPPIDASLKRCVQCTDVKNRIADFRPRWGHCKSHEDFTVGCLRCKELVNHKTRQPRCKPCETQRGKKIRFAERIQTRLVEQGRHATAVKLTVEGPAFKLKMLEILPEGITSEVTVLGESLNIKIENTVSDEARSLTNRVRAGDKVAAAELLKRVEPMIRKVARANNDEDQLDLLQEARLAVYRKVVEGDYDPTRSKLETFATWKARGAVSTERRRMKKAASMQSYSQTAASDEDGAGSVDRLFARMRSSFGAEEESDYEGVELREVVGLALSKLDPIDATVVRLRVVEELTVREVEALSQTGEHGLPPMSRSAVLVRQKRAEQSMRELLTQEMK